MEGAATTIYPGPRRREAGTKDRGPGPNDTAGGDEVSIHHLDPAEGPAVVDTGKEPPVQAEKTLSQRILEPAKGTASTADNRGTK